MLNKKQAMIVRRDEEVKQPMARLVTEKLLAFGAKTATTFSAGNRNNCKIKTKNKNETKMKLKRMRKKRKKRKMFEPFNIEAIKPQQPKIQFIKRTVSLSISCQLAIWLTLSAIIGLSSSSSSSLSSDDLSSSFASLTQQLNIEGSSSSPSSSSSAANNILSTAATSSSSSNNQDLEQPRQVALQLALVSAKGTLAFWNPQVQAQNNNLNLADQDLLSLLKSNLHYVKPSSVTTPILSNRPGSGPGTSCFKNQLPGASSSSSTGSVTKPVAAELLAVEGSSIKLNLVILGQRYTTSSSQSSSSLTTTSMLANEVGGGFNTIVGQVMSKLSLKWTKNYNENLSTTTTTSSTSRNSRFYQQIINENDLIRQYYGTRKQQPSGGVTSSSTSSTAAAAATNFQRQTHSNSNSHHHHRNASSLNNNKVQTTDFANFNSQNTHLDYFQQNRQPSNAPDMAQFMLAPHVDERLISKLEKSLQLDAKLFNAINAQIKLAQQQQQQQQPQRQQQQQKTSGSNSNINMQDDFLAEGQSIDWQKLESYLRFNAAQLKIDLSPSLTSDNEGEDSMQTVATTSPTYPQLLQQVLQQQQQQQQQSEMRDCPKLLPNIEQFVVVQVEINQLTINDGGLYQLEVCGRDVDCQYLSFYLHIGQDIPILESKPEHQILEVGDRLTIKCEATSFTLPQITWFLDGQQLNEHQFYGTSGGLTSMFDILSPSANQHLSNVGSGVNSNSFGGTFNGNSGSIIIGAGSKLRIGDYVSQNNHVHSFVNSSSVQITDGGFYKCQANNGYHTVEHEARIDVRGLPTISRQLNNISVLVGQNRLHIQCPYSGYPISSVEWYYRPLISSNYINYNMQQGRGVGQLRAKRGPLIEEASSNDNLPSRSVQSSSFLDESDDLFNSGIEVMSNLDGDKDNDPDKDEWLSQASAMTQSPNQEDYPEPMPDYPPPGLIPSNVETLRDFDGSELGMVDYGDLQMDFQQQQQHQQPVQLLSQIDENDDDSNGDTKSVIGQTTTTTRKKRETTADNAGSPEWIKFPQSRRHQIHINGTLIIQDVSRTDQGFYKCRVLSKPQSSLNSPSIQDFNALNEQQQQQQQLSGGDQSSGSTSHLSAENTFVVSSNEFYLNTLVAPVISPFSSAESLREGMRNFLTCSVIEGDSPVRLRWFKDNQSIDEYIQQEFAGSGSSQASKAGEAPNQARIRVETSNEYTSTLYFSHVDFKDNGNYTCMATNKAASVNYTARMPVNVPPKWIKAPKDLECVSGQNIVIDCQAEAHPNPRVWWEIGVYSQALDSQASSPSLSSSSALSNSISSYQMKQEVIKNKLNSNVGDQTLPQITATNNNHLHPPNHYRTIISNSRIHILENASLVIKDVHRQDQGYYLCQAANNFGSLSSLIKLTVNVGASFPNKYLVKYVKLNERIEFDCDPIGQSPVDVIWFIRPQISSMTSKSHNNISNPSTLSVRHQIGPDSYQNQLMTNHSSPPSSSFEHQKQAVQTNTGGGLGRRLYMATIRTEFSHRDVPKYSSASIASQSNSGGMSQQNLNLESYIRSQSPSLIMPEHVLDEQITPFLSEPYMSFELMRRQTDSEFLRLIIKQAKRQHSTDFICKATNKFGSDEKLIKLLVQEPPDPVQEITLVQVDSRSMSITWMPPYNGNSPITSYTVEWAPINNQLFSNNFSSSPTTSAHKSSTLNISPTGSTPQQTTTNITTSTIGLNNNVSHLKWSHSITLQPAFTMSSLQPLTSYEIRIKAHNLFGQSSYPSNRLPIIVTTTEEAPTTPPSDIRVVPLSSSSIQITWLPPTQDVVQTSNSLLLNSPSSSIEELKFNGPKYSIKGYYLGYKVTNSNESFVYKTVSLSSQPLNENNGIILAQQEISTTNSQQQLIHNATFYNKKGLTTTTAANNDNSRLKVVVDDLKRSTKYSISVQAFNSAGPGPQSDQIEVKTLANDPPPAPLLRVGIVTYTSIELQWSFQLDLVNKFEANLINNTTDRFKIIDSIHSEEQQQNLKQQHTEDNKHVSKNAPIEGYLLYYRQLDGQWIERKLTPETHTMIASNHQRNDLSIIELSTNSAELLNVNNAMTSMPTSMAETITTSAVATTTTTTTTSATITSNEAVITTSSHNSPQIGWHKNTSLAHKSFRFILNQLSCGTPYQLYLVAYNSIGSGLRSQVIRTKTRGLAPIAPRKQDYITLNSTYVQLNFDAWMDGGCSIGNFEIRYKQLYPASRSGQHQSQSRAPTSPYPASILLNENSNNSSSGSSSSNQQQWLLLSNNISPEQRMIELRDLQPETWYSILTTAESAAGKTEVQHSFMTLDKFGQLPAEAVESASNLPALFRNNASIRSILYNFTTSGNSMSSSSLIMSACLALILFATCSLFLIRRYNNTMKDSVSMDSQTTSAVLGSSTSQFHRSNNNNNGSINQRNHLNHRQQTSHHHHQQQQHVTGGGYSNILHLDDSNSFDIAHNNNGKHTNNNHYNQTAAYGLAREHYSLKDSPCKTTTATIITGSSTNDSSGIMTGSSLCNDELATNSNYAPTEQTATTTVDLNRFMMDHRDEDNHDNCIQHPQYAHNTNLPSANHDALDDFCSASCASASINSPNKFSTIVRNNNNIEQHNVLPLQSSRFKTMPHQRPVSSFIPNGNYQNTGRCFYNTNNQQQQQQLNNDQQIYSKLRLIYNSHSNYNICPEGQKGASVELPGQLYNPDSNNMSMLATQQQNQQKMLSCSLKAGNQPQQQQLGMYLSNGFNNQIPESDPNELTSLLLECQHPHHQQQQIVDSNEGYTQCQAGQQQIHLNNQQVLDPNTTDYIMACNVPSVSSSSNSASNSTTTQQTSSSSMSSNGNNNSCGVVNGSSNEQHQLTINMTNGNNNLNIPVGQQCPKMMSNQMKVATNQQQQQNVSSQPQQQQQQQTNQPTSNEQSDYALPFPPKWV